MHIISISLLIFLNTVFSGPSELEAKKSSGPRHAEYKAALYMSLITDKPVLLHFTSDYCRNPIHMKEMFRSDAQLKELFEGRFIYLELSVSDSRSLESEEVYHSPTGIAIRTHGARNADLEMTVFGENVQPYLVIVNGTEETLGTSKHLSTPEELREFLTSVLK